LGTKRVRARRVIPPPRVQRRSKPACMVETAAWAVVEVMVMTDVAVPPDVRVTDVGDMAQEGG